MPDNFNTTSPPPQRFDIGHGRRVTLHLTDEERRVLAGNLMEGQTQSVEILWRWEMPEREERMAELRVLQREKVAEKAQEWLRRLHDEGLQPLNPSVESLILQAFLAGWKAAPLGPRAIKP